MAGTHFYGSQFFGGEFFFGRVEIIDTHDGERQRKLWESQRLAREDLRNTIRAALESELAPKLAPKLETFAKAGTAPIEKRIDYQLFIESELWIEMHRRMLDDDDEEVLLLLGE